MPLSQTIIQFPEIQLQTRDAHKLRGYFGNLFMEKSELLHNHMGNGELRYAYPQVQYKVIDEAPMIVGINEGARLLTELFLQIKELNIDGRVIPIQQKNIEAKSIEIGIAEEPVLYEFKTLWMALNQKNHASYEKASNHERRKLLERTLVGNCLSFLKGMDHFVEERIVVEAQFKEKVTHFKNARMLAFEGIFKVNVELPDFIGLGKQVSRGFGTIRRM